MKVFKILGINLLVLVVCLIIIEIAFGGWFNSENNLSNLGVLKDTKYRFSVESVYPNLDKKISYSRDKYGLRGIKTYSEPGKIDILTIGGSTTDQRYIDDQITWQEHLEDLLDKEGKQYLISNAGIDGQSTFGHIKNFELWFSQVKGLKPKYILFYIGINDLLKQNQKLDFDFVAVNEYTLSKKIKHNIKNKSVVYNLVRKIKGTLLAYQTKAYHTKVNFNKVEYIEKGVATNDTKEYNKNCISTFKQRLKELIILSEKMGAIPIFITQPSARYKIVDGKVFGASKIFRKDNLTFNGVDYYYFLLELNKGIYEVSADKYQIINLSSLENWEQDDFYDFSHMTPKGARKLANEISNKIKL